MAWPDPWNYPRETADKVFLANAFEMVARAQFPEGWNSSVVDIKQEFIPSKLSRATSSQLKKAKELLRQQARQADAKDQNFSGTITEADLQAAQQLEQEEMAKWSADSKRWSELKGLFQTALLEGRVKSFLRPKAGGAFVGPVDASVWNVDDCSDRFGTCLMRPRPFDDASPGNEPHLIYLDRGDLERVFLGDTPKQSEADSPTHLSPYLDVMLQASRDLAITGDNQPKKVEVESKIQTLWKQKYPDLKLSERLLKSMGTLVREPDSQRGRRPK